MTLVEDAQRIASESGNTFHFKVASHIRSKQWKVMLSPYYLDSATDKARELDLFCEREILAIGRRTGTSRALRIQLYIECKYINKATVFWFDRHDHFGYNSWLATHVRFMMTHPSELNHHYVMTMDSSVANVAKLFASQRGQNDENDPIYKAVSQSLGGLIHFRDVASPFQFSNTNVPTTTLRYPVIIHSGGSHFFRTGANANGTVEPLDDNFLLEVNYAYVGHNDTRALEYFLIDVVDFNKLDVFLDMLDQEATHALQLLHAQADAE